MTHPDTSCTFEELTATNSGYSNFILLNYRSIFVGITTGGNVLVFKCDNEGIYHNVPAVGGMFNSVNTAKDYFIVLIGKKLNQLYGVAD